MSNLNPDLLAAVDPATGGEDSNFGDILSNFEQQHHEAASSEKISGTIVSVTAAALLVDIGRKIEGSLPLDRWREISQEEPQRGGKIEVTVGPRNEEGFYQLSTVKVERPKDWSGLEAAFAEKKNIVGHVLEQVKGGFRVDVGIKAFMPASRSGVREADEMPKLVGQEISCRITKLDKDKDDIVVDRRVVVEEEQAQRKQAIFETLAEGQTVRGRVRTIMEYGAFLDIGSVDGLLHVMDMSWSRVGKPGDVVKIGDELDVKIIRIDPTTKKISLGLKQLQEEPWTLAARQFTLGDRVSGNVSRLTDFGAFVELIPGVDGLIHLSELSWDKRIRKASDLLKVGDRVEVVILQVNPTDKRIGLGLKQTLGDPWEAIPEKYPVGETVEAPVSNVANFGAFVDLGDGIEGLIHISDITNEKRLEHPRELLTKGQTVKAVVLEIEKDRRRIRLGMKQLEPTTVDHYIAEHRQGETVSGRLVDVHASHAKVELGEGVFATCRMKAPDEQKDKKPPQQASADVSSLSAMLAARWKQGAGEDPVAKEKIRAGQVRTFRIATLDPAKRSIELELAG